jgi:hypothetical protein
VSYRKVDTRLWDDERVAPLSALAKLTWLCLLTGPHTTGLPGLYSCGIATLSESMREGIDTVSKAVADLVATGMVQFNPTVRVVRVPNAPRYNPCSNEKVLKGWFALWKSIPDCAEKFSHIERLRDALDPSSSWVEKGWAGTFGTVSVPSRYRIQTVPNSTATTTATATTDSPPGSAEGATAPDPLPPVVPPSGERTTTETAKATEATTKGDDAKPAKRKRAKAAPTPDTIPAPNTLARRVYEAIVGDRGLCAIVVNPGDAAERWADPATYPGVNVLAEVKKAGDWLVTARRPPRDGRAFLRNWLSDAAAKTPKVAAPRVPDADGYINRPDPPRPPQYVKILQGDEITRALEEAETTGPFAWALRGRKRATVQGG